MKPTKVLALVILVPALFVAGCATAYDPTPNIYDISVTSEQTVKDDIADCAQYAQNFKRPFNIASAGASTGSGAAGNLSAAAVPGAPLGGLAGPLLGGLGGLLQALTQYAGLIDTDRPRAEQQCLFQRFSKDHAGTLVEPPL